MTLSVFQAVRGQRSLEDIVRAIPDALRPLLVFDRVSLSLDRGDPGALSRYVFEGECAARSANDQTPPDLAAHGLQSTCAVPLTAPQRALGILEIASHRRWITP